MKIPQKNVFYYIEKIDTFNSNYILFAAFLLILSLIINLDIVSANLSEEKSDEMLFYQIKSWATEHIRNEGEIIGYTLVQRAISGSQNPDNRLLNITRSEFNVEMRPNFYVNWKKVSITFKPRWHGNLSYWDEGPNEGEWKGDDELFVNEWLIRLMPVDNFFVSYGREILQWGPSYFLSPTNPFFRDNGRSNPKDEVDGTDFVRIIWNPSIDWNFSLIANTSEGRKDVVDDDFHKSYAFKIDYTRYRKYGSIIFSKREDQSLHVGGYGGATPSDAILLYTEADFSLGSYALYPVDDPTSLFGISMENDKTDSNSLKAILLAGGSYTTEWGPTFVLEYLYNAHGYNSEDAAKYYDLANSAGINLNTPNPLNEHSRYVLFQTLEPGLRLLRRNYISAQYQHIGIDNHLDLVIRFTLNIDDYSGLINPIIEYDLTDRIQLFLVGTQTFGGKNTEFRRLIDYSFWVGLEYYF